MTETIRHETITPDAALDMAAMVQAGYTYIWYQEQSRVGICRLTDYQPDSQHLIEARIFRSAGRNEDASEVHVFYGQDGQRRAVVTHTAGTAPYSEERQLLLPIFGKSLTVRTVYTYDEDGQVMPGASLLTGYEDGGRDGE